LSGELAGEPHAAHLPEQRAKAAGELAVRTSGVPFTIFRPTYFMETLPRHIQGNRAIVIGRSGPALPMIAAEDFGRLVAKALVTQEAAGRTLYANGPQSATIGEAVRRYCELFAPRATVMRMPISMMRLLDILKFRGELRGTIDLMQVYEKVGPVGDASETERILFRPETTLRQWLDRRAAQRDHPQP
jgi:uncharacterized protein YbjT (DUF2867 family)